MPFVGVLRLDVSLRQCPWSFLLVEGLRCPAIIFTAAGHFILPRC